MYGMYLNHYSGIFPNLRVTRQRNFAAVVYGLLTTRQTKLAGLARRLGNGLGFRANEKRLKRFFSWKTVTLSGVSAKLIPLVVSRMPASRPVSLLLDTTTVFWGLECLTVAVPLRGRAVPIAARLYWKVRPAHSQNLLEEHFLRSVITHIPKRYSVCVVADRGFGRTEFLEFLLTLNEERLKGVHFAIRVKKGVTITDEWGKTSLLSRRWVRVNGTRVLRNVLYRQDKALTVDIVLAHQTGAKERWYIATNLPDPKEARGRYEQRFQIEEIFKDMKHQLGLEWTRLRDIKKVGKLIAALLLCCVLLIFLGKDTTQRFWRFVTDPGKLSGVAIALALLLHPPPGYRRTVTQTLRQLTPQVVS